MDDIILTDSTPPETAYWTKEWTEKKEYSLYRMIVLGKDSITYHETTNCVVSNKEYKKLGKDSRAEFSPLTKSKFDSIVSSSSLRTAHYSGQEKYGDRIIGIWKII